MMAKSRTRLLRTVLAFATIEPQTPELRLLHRWLDPWRGEPASAHRRRRRRQGAAE
jgi:hypothetical protein